MLPGRLLMLYNVYCPDMQLPQVWHCAETSGQLAGVTGTTFYTENTAVHALTLT